MSICWSESKRQIAGRSADMFVARNPDGVKAIIFHEAKGFVLMLGPHLPKRTFPSLEAAKLAAELML